MQKSVVERRSNAAAVHPHCEQVPLSQLIPAAVRLRRHSKAKRSTLLRSVAKNGLITPIIINAASLIIDGHARVDAARELGWSSITAIRVEHLSDEDLRLYAIAANKMPADADWDMDALRLELEAIEVALPTIDLSLSGFSVPQIDAMRGAYEAGRLNDLEDDAPNPPLAVDAVSALGDLWLLGRHRLLCGDATDHASVARLMGDERASQIFIDPPYNVPIDKNVAGHGKVNYREFCMASGELSISEFTSFLERALTAANAHMNDGGLAYVCMDHAHLGELLEAGGRVFTERKAICVWDKSATSGKGGGMGSLYRSVHEMVVVFKKGTAKHINNVALGKHGRNRTTIWRYPGMGGFGKGRAKALSMHPTIKPVALVADALLDASPRGGVVLDSFAGSGTTLIAAEKTHRQARLMELDPGYVDAIIMRFEALTGGSAICVETGETFAERGAARDQARSMVASAAAGGK